MPQPRKRPITIVTPAIWLALGMVWSVAALQYPLFNENQNTKFLHAASKTGYGFLAHDWMAGTIDPLPAFTLLIETLFRLHGIWLVYLLFPALVAILIWSLTSIADRLYGIRRKLAAVALFLGVLFIEQKNLQLGFGTQYLIGHYFQPCVFGVLILLAIERFLAEARLQASALLAVAAAFHPAYMPAALLIQGSFTALTLFQDKRITMASVMPLLLFVALSAPLVIRYKLLFGFTTPQIGAEAMSILSNQRISTHTKVRNWLNLEDYVGMAIIVLSMIMVRKSRLFWIMAPLAAVIAVSVPLLYFIYWPSLEVLTPWRTSVILLPLAYTILASWFASRFIPLMERNRLVSNFLFAVGCICITLPALMHLKAQANLLTNPANTPESAVIRFARTHSVQQDIWLIPTRDGLFDSFRLETGSPILANWKTHPYKDSEIIEWYRRNKAAESFYEQAGTATGPALLRELGKKYGITHAVVRSDVPTKLYTGIKVCWQDTHYKVFGL